MGHNRRLGNSHSFLDGRLPNKTDYVNHMSSEPKLLRKATVSHVSFVPEKPSPRSQLIHHSEVKNRARAL